MASEEHAAMGWYASSRSCSGRPTIDNEWRKKLRGHASVYLDYTQLQVHSTEPQVLLETLFFLNHYQHI